MTKSPVTVCNDLWIEMKKNHKTIEKKEILLRVNPEVTKQLKLNNGKWLTEMEAMTGKTILLKSDPILHPEQFEMR
jgi:ribonuclease G